MLIISILCFHSNKMTGLCGDCNGLLDDLRTEEGVNVQYEDNKYSLISDSFVVDESEDGDFNK